VTLETMIKRAFVDWAEEAQVPAGLADRALRRRTRQRSLKIVVAMGSTVLLVGAAAVVAVSATGTTPRPPASVIRPEAVSMDTTLRTDLSDSFPRHLVAAGHTAVAAYVTGRWLPSAKKPKNLERTWYLYNQSSLTYQKTSWTYLDVAPGMHRAAVLDGPLPTSRVGILDLSTNKVTRWISFDHQVGGVSWAQDGRRLVLTTYDKNPDSYEHYGENLRTGFYLMDADAEPGSFHSVPGNPDNPNSRTDFEWSHSGALIKANTGTKPYWEFYDLNGKPQPAPPFEADSSQQAGLSPKGNLITEFGPGAGPNVTVTNVKTTTVVAILPIEQALAWADDDHLFAIGCAEKDCSGSGEFHNRLLLVGLDGTITPLTGFRDSQAQGAWVPLFTHR
jgi:hypothetical protein